jgi:PAS domain S-box-containing protein
VQGRRCRAGCADAGLQPSDASVASPRLTRIGDERTRRTLRLFLFAAAVETAFALVRRAHDAARLLDGERSWDTVSGLVGLLWMPLMLVALVLTALQLLRASRQQAADAASLAAAGATSSDWHWEIDRDLVLTDSNERIHDVLGYHRDQVIGRPVSELWADPASAQMRQLLQAALRTGTGWHDVMTEWRHANGGTVRLVGSAAALCDSAGRVIGLRGARRPPSASAAAARADEATRREVRALLDDGGLQMAVQPIYDLVGGQLAGFEALARFPGRDAEELFDRAQRVGVGLELELAAIRAALPLLAVLPGHAYLAVNASPELLLDGRLLRLLRSPGLDLGRLVVEVTERTPIIRYDELGAQLMPLRAAGLRLAVDDTGAGYASFAHVLRLRPDIIKLDRSLVSAIDTDPAQRSLVTAVTLLALDLEAVVSAEGIETAAQLQALTDLGIRSGQGFHLGRPTLDPTDWAATLPPSARRRRSTALPTRS